MLTQKLTEIHKLYTKYVFRCADFFLFFSDIKANINSNIEIILENTMRGSVPYILGLEVLSGREV